MESNSFVKLRKAQVFVAMGLCFWWLQALDPAGQMGQLYGVEDHTPVVQTETDADVDSKYYDDATEPAESSSTIPEASDEASLKILALHQKVRGGKEALLAQDTYRITGVLKEGKRLFYAKASIQLPDKYRVECFSSHLGQDFTIIHLRNGDKSFDAILGGSSYRPETEFRGNIDPYRFIHDFMLMEALVDRGGEPVILDFKKKVHLLTQEKDSYLVTGYIDRNPPMDFYFHHKNFLLRCIAYQEETISGKPTVRAYFVEQNRVNGIIVPRQIETFLGRYAAPARVSEMRVIEGKPLHDVFKNKTSKGMIRISYFDTIRANVDFPEDEFSIEKLQDAVVEQMKERRKMQERLRRGY